MKRLSDYRHGSKNEMNYKNNPFTHEYIFGNYSKLYEEIKSVYKNSEWFIKYGNRFKIPENDIISVYNFLKSNISLPEYSQKEISVAIVNFLDINYKKLND